MSSEDYEQRLVRLEAGAEASAKMREVLAGNILVLHKATHLLRGYLLKMKNAHTALGRFVFTDSARVNAEVRQELQNQLTRLELEGENLEAVLSALDLNFKMGPHTPRVSVPPPGTTAGA